MNGGDEIIMLAAPNAEEKQKWMKALAAVSKNEIRQSDYVNEGKLAWQ